jgi:hypothetical protein
MKSVARDCGAALAVEIGVFNGTAIDIEDGKCRVRASRRSLDGPSVDPVVRPAVLCVSIAVALVIELRRGDVIPILVKSLIP